MTGAHSYPQDEVEKWHTYARALHGRIRYKVLNESAAQFAAWVSDQAVANHCRGIFKWTKGVQAALPRSVPGIWQKGMVDEPLALAEHRRKQWAQWWCRAPQTLLVTMSRIKDVRTLASMEEYYVFSIIHLDNALYTFADDTALGSDQVGPRFVNNIPLEARMQLLAFYNKCFRSVMWP